jgi:hypothetical protein
MSTFLRSVPRRNYMINNFYHSVLDFYSFFFTCTDSSCVKFVSSENSGCHNVAYLLIFALQKNFRENVELCS